MVPRARVELARLAALDFESSASTDSAIGAILFNAVSTQFCGNFQLPHNKLILLRFSTTIPSLLTYFESRASTDSAIGAAVRKRRTEGGRIILDS